MGFLDEIGRGSLVKRNNSTQKVKCWVGPVKKFLSFHHVNGFLKKDFIDRTQMLVYCNQLIEPSYNVQ